MSYVRADYKEVGMGVAYSMEFRMAVAKAYDECLSSLNVAEMFGCSESWVRRLIQRQRECGSLEPLVPKHPDRRSLDDQDMETLRLLIEDKPDMTLAELAAALGYKASVTTIWRATRKLNLTYKKKTQHASEQERPDVKKAREEWFDKFADVEIKQLVFIDEFAATTNMTRTRARGPRGKRVVCKTPHGHYKTLSTIAAMTVKGILNGLVFEGATTTCIFEDFVEQHLVPKLKRGQVVVMDNLTAHKSPHVKALIESVGARVLLLPAYSPDFNPIEMAISKIKSYLRKLGARTVKELLEALEPALKSVTPSDAINYVFHCGYAATVT
jgi:transposase